MLRFAWIATNLLGLAIILVAIFFHKAALPAFMIGSMLMTISNAIKFQVFRKR